jgi:hypothetical protein
VNFEALANPEALGYFSRMDHQIFRTVCVMGALAFGVLITNVDAQRRAPGQAQPTQAIQAALKVGGATYQSSQAGKCTHAPVASIYNTVAELWSVQQNGEGQSLSLTLWKPKDGSGDMVTLSVTSGNVAHQVSTVRGGTTAGSGKVTLEKSGNGGTFSVDAKSSSGASISGTIKCDAFAPHMAEGG